MQAAFALTFDDGPGPSTPAILDILRNFGVKATFFVVGKNVENPHWHCAGMHTPREIITRILHEGHQLGNHSYSHHGNDQGASFLRDVRRCDAVLRPILRDAGAPEAPLPIRLPYGLLKPSGNYANPFSSDCSWLDSRIFSLAAMGRGHVHWTGIFGDWNMSASDGAKLAEMLIEHVRWASANGLPAVIALHDGVPPNEEEGSDFTRPGTVAALPLFLQHAAREKWTPFALPWECDATTGIYQDSSTHQYNSVVCGLVPGQPITSEARLSLRSLLKQVYQGDWGSQSHRVARYLTMLQDKFGRIGYLTPDYDWRPGIFMGFMYNGDDHCVQLSDPLDGPDFSLIIDFDLRQPKVTLYKNHPAYRRLVERLNRDAPPLGFEFLNHPAASRGGNINWWHPLHLRQNVLRLLKGRQSEHEQVTILRDSARQVLDYLFAGGEIDEMRRDFEVRT